MEDWTQAKELRALAPEEDLGPALITHMVALLHFMILLSYCSLNGDFRHLNQFKCMQLTNRGLSAI